MNRKQRRAQAAHKRHAGSARESLVARISAAVQLEMGLPDANAARVLQRLKGVDLPQRAIDAIHDLFSSPSTPAQVKAFQDAQLIGEGTISIEGDDAPRGRLEVLDP